MTATDQHYLKNYRKVTDNDTYTVTLQFDCFAGWWKVYHFKDGEARNWGFTVGKRWKTEKEVIDHLRELGWNPC